MISWTLVAILLEHLSMGVSVGGYDTIEFYETGNFFKSLNEYQTTWYVSDSVRTETSGCQSRQGESEEATRGEFERVCRSPSLFCPVNSCCVPGKEECGCWESSQGKCQELMDYRVHLGSCSGDGLRVWADHQVGVVKRGENFEDLVEQLCGRTGVTAEALIELNDKAELGIRITTTKCGDVGGISTKGQTSFMEDQSVVSLLAARVPTSPSHGSAASNHVVAIGHSIRIEDPDGYLMEKFLLRVLQNVDIGSLMNDFSRHIANDNEENNAKTNPGNYSTRWGCEPVTPTVFLSPEFSDFAQKRSQTLTLLESESCAVDGTCRYSHFACSNSSCCVSHNLSENGKLKDTNSYLQCGCYSNSTGTCHKVRGWNAQWQANTLDGVAVQAQVFHHFQDTTIISDECEAQEDEDAAVILDLMTDENAGKEWKLFVQFSQCILLEKPRRYVRFTGSLTLSESSLYQRMLKVAREYVVKRRKTLRGKLGELLKDSNSAAQRVLNTNG